MSNKLFDISKKYDLSYYNGQNIHLANPLKSLKFKPTKSNMEDIVFFMDVARLGYTPLRILDSKKQTGVSFVGTCNITNATLQEITEGVAKEI